MLKIVMLIIISINLFGGGVDIIIDTFDSLKEAQTAKRKLRDFIEKNSIPATNIKIESIDDIYYIKIGTFNQAVRDDERLLATFALKYPNLVLVPQSTKDYSTKFNPSKEKSFNTESFIQKNSSNIQWILIVVMALWGGVILLLRFKTVSRVKKEQKIIKQEQKDIEGSLNQTERIGDGF